MTSFSQSHADMVSAFTMNYVEEAIGICLAAQENYIPVVISFTVETNGKLPSGQTLKDAILQVDRETNSAPAYYMINSAHPSHFNDVIHTDEVWLNRIRGVRANASCKSHAELDNSDTLDAGNPIELGQQYSTLLHNMEKLNIFGGCCGTGLHHMEKICEHVLNPYDQRLKGKIAI